MRTDSLEELKNLVREAILNPNEAETKITITDEVVREIAKRKAEEDESISKKIMALIESMPKAVHDEINQTYDCLSRIQDLASRVKLKATYYEYLETLKLFIDSEII